MNAIVKITQTKSTGFHLTKLEEESLAASMADPDHCHYFALDLSVIGLIPFFSIEELNWFTAEVDKQRPNFVKRLKFGVMTKEEAMEHTECEFRKFWQKQHQERLIDIKKQQLLKVDQERKKKLQEWLDRMVTDEHYCHYFAVFHKGTEVYPFGLNQAPYYTLEEALEIKNQYILHHPDKEFYVSSGAIDSEFTFSKTIRTKLKDIGLINIKLAYKV